ncbi:MULTISPECIES: ABC transporter permease [unclassified Frondihabitans]|uniref:ABC transporter permease n=1 Tax=unclassified Frondihabitans TaxID=2626248 RepID=UPI0006FF6030|nr:MULTISPECIES: ABC transporter permease [unclassified Frondihabitans]KQQ28806.1 peptide ABC transporter permease [Frondihabitans sp. Leaf304]RPE78167.1 peptide/nickel transport system permease protein [Frondihabitans sp. PhB153]RPF08448.1 peptide/nickel transport system permease protein [Frondihabitans sp. PhB161]
MKYALRKVGLLILTLWAAITLNFFLPRLMPGSPTDAAIAKLSQNGPVTAATRKAIEIQLGVPDGNVLEQYLQYLKQVVTLQFGISYTFYPQPVAELVSQALPYTLILVGLVTIVAFVCGTLLGVLAAWKRGTWLDALPTLGGSFASAFPYFWTALLLLFFLGYVFKIFPTSGAYGVTNTPGLNAAFLGSAAVHAVLPAVTILITSLGGWILGMRNTMISTLGDDYVTFAEANGLKPRTVALRYAARNAILPNLTSFGLALGGVVGGSVLVETVFGYPGIGYLLLKAVTNQDYPLMQALFLMITVSVLLANFLVDILYGVLDPRTRK